MATLYKNRNIWYITVSNGNKEANIKKSANVRIYKEYVSTLNELFDKWTSLRLLNNSHDGKSND